MKDGGAGYVYNLAAQLAKQGLTVTVLTTNKVAGHYRNQTFQDFDVLPVIDSWKGLSGIRQLRNMLSELSPDIIHLIYPSSFFGNNFMSPLFLRCMSSKPIVTTFFSLFLKGSNVFTKIGILYLILSSSRIISHDDKYIAFFEKFFPFKRVHFVPVGNNFESECKKNTPLRENYGLREDLNYLAFIGRADISKGVEDLLLAFSKLIRDNSNKFKLLMIGAGDPERINEGEGHKRDLMDYERRLFDIVDELDLREEIVWTGYCSEDDFVNYIICSDIVVLPFRSNFLGRSSLACALSLGKPVITTAPKKNRYLRDGINSILVSPESPDSIAEAVFSLLDNHELKDKIGDGARNVFERYLTWDIVIKKILEEVYAPCFDGAANVAEI
jgi:glycosyltransferase involved in cell wall biosynthesis